MNCPSPEHELLAFWVAGTLSAEEEARVKSHVAGCPECRSAAAEIPRLVRGLRSLHLTSEEVVAAAWGEGSHEHLEICVRCRDEVETLRTMNRQLPSPAPSPRWLRNLAWAASLAFVAVTTATLVKAPAQAPVPPSPRPSGSRPTEPPVASPDSAVGTSQPADGLDRLAAVDPPQYLNSAPRGEAREDPDFVAAMSAYASRNYAQAALRLRLLAKRQPDHIDGRFFLGICELVLGNTAAATADLRWAAGSGSAEYAEAARFHLAKALVRNRDIEGARTELKRLVDGGGDYAGSASALLRELNTLPSSPQ